MSTASAIFNPTPDRASRVLADLNDTSLSFDDLASKHGTSAEALSLWLCTSAIKERVQPTLDAMALRIRMIAASRLPAALRAITELIETGPVLPARVQGPRGIATPDAASASITPGIPGTFGAPGASDPFAAPDSLREREFRRRHNESLRRACSLLLGLANFFSPTRPPAPRTAHHSPAPDSIDDPHGPSRASSNPAQRPTTTNGAHPVAAHRPRFIAPALASLMEGTPACSVESPRSQPEGLSVNSRGLSKSASDSPGIGLEHPAHPEGVHVATNQLNGANSLATGHNPKPSPVDLPGSSAVAAPSAFSSLSSELSLAPATLAKPRSPPPGAYQRPRRRFKFRR